MLKQFVECDIPMMPIAMIILVYLYTQMFDKQQSISKQRYSPFNATYASTSNQPKPSTYQLSELDLYLNMHRFPKQNNRNQKLMLSVPNKFKSNMKTMFKISSQTPTNQLNHQLEPTCHLIDDEATFFENHGIKNNGTVSGKVSYQRSEQKYKVNGNLNQHQISNQNLKKQKLIPNGKANKIGEKQGASDKKKRNGHTGRADNHIFQQQLPTTSIFNTKSSKTTIEKYTDEGNEKTRIANRSNSIKFSKARKPLSKQATTAANQSSNLENIEHKLDYVPLKKKFEHKRINSGNKNSQNLTRHEYYKPHRIHRINLHNLIKKKCDEFVSGQNTAQILNKKDEITESPVFSAELQSKPQSAKYLQLNYYSQSIKNKRNYNEDRYIHRQLVSPYHSYTKADKNSIPNYMLFGVFDGHGGSACSTFIEKNLPTFLQNNKSLINDPKACLENSIHRLEEQFLKICQKKGSLETSGSTATSCLFINNKGRSQVIIANVGDSRICIVGQDGVVRLTKDHKPEDQLQKKRIIRNGGKLYKQEISNRGIIMFYESKQNVNTKPNIKKFTQTRILPGSLNVSRTIGDIQVKMKRYGGSQGIVIADPEMSTYQPELQKYDTMILGSDGLYQGLTDKQIHEIYKEQKNNIKEANHDLFCECLTKRLIRAAAQNSSDNITVVTVLMSK